ncbi:hypothetical protein KAS79_03795 [Candidatus Parcubacteria bacterium]|nr:hypothetical protein [Candidatus Parcubacteria bacterium]
MLKQKNVLLKFVFLGIIAVFGFGIGQGILAQEDDNVCIVYFTGIGCTHCAQADPLVLEQLTKEYPNLVIVEYEIYQQKENAPLLYEYNSVYDSGLGIPLIIFNKQEHILGDKPILDNVREMIENKDSNKCPLIDGSSVHFKDLDIDSLPGKPKILKQGFQTLPDNPGQSSGKIKTQLTLAKILSLAAVDAVNPCALAVLILMLTAILTYNPKDKKRVLLTGLAFVASVFVMYFFYGLIIIKFFQTIQVLTSVKIWIYKFLGGAATILGILNIRDFLKYKPGGFLTEMPMFLRPKVKKIISGITSPKGAFGVGAFVTVFLLPCTIGPYIICGGILSACELMEIFPWLLMYNLIFIFPMLVIIGLIYLGLRKVEDVSAWKEKNIRYLHLIAGLIIFGLGLAMVFGFV